MFTRKIILPEINFDRKGDYRRSNIFYEVKQFLFQRADKTQNINNTDNIFILITILYKAIIII